MPDYEEVIEAQLKDGWAHLKEGNPQLARLEFEAALEEDPFSREAYDGILECRKARFWFYRMVQRYGVKFTDVVTGNGKLSTGWFLAIFGAIPGGLLKTIRTSPDLGPVLWPIVLAMLGYLVVSQLADNIATIALRLSGDEDEPIATSYVVNAYLGIVFLLSTVGSVGLYFRVDHIATLLAALLLFILVVSIEATFKPRLGQMRWAMVAFLLGLIGCATATVAIAAIRCEGTDWNEHIPASAGICFLIVIAGVIGSHPLANMLLQLADRGISHLDLSMYASNPGKFELDESKLRLLHPELYGWRALFHGWFYSERGVSAKEARSMLRENLIHGDSRAAVVIETEPLRVAAYTDELDCIAILEFSKKISSRLDLRKGDRLLTVNSFSNDPPGVDLRPGLNARGRFNNFWPIVVQFMTNDTAPVKERMANISNEEWARLVELSKQYLRAPWTKPRDGRPLLSHVPPQMFE